MDGYPFSRVAHGAVLTRHLCASCTRFYSIFAPESFTSFSYLT
jgi:hypothetical protein